MAANPCVSVLPKFGSNASDRMEPKYIIAFGEYIFPMWTVVFRHPVDAGCRPMMV
jgi:hypothetical protein